MKEWNGELPLRYCHEKDMCRKRFIFLMFKACFLAKLKMMKLQGINYFVLARVESWIEKNIDMLYQRFLVNKGKITYNLKDGHNYRHGRCKHLSTLEN